LCVDQTLKMGSCLGAKLIPFLPNQITIWKNTSLYIVKIKTFLFYLIYEL
jgi:hypothetical protein